MLVSRHDNFVLISDYLRNRKIPRNQSSRHTNGLLDGYYTTAWNRGRKGRPLNPLRLAGEPSRKRCRVLDFSKSLSKRLSSLIDEDSGEVFSMFSNQGVPLGKLIDTLSGIDRSVLQEGIVSG